MALRAATVSVALLTSLASLAFAAGHFVPARAIQAPGPAGAAGNAAFYTDHVQPIFQANCYRCHAGLNHRGGLVLDSPAGILKGGHDGAVIVPGHPEQSLLVKLIRHEGPPNDPMPMPPKGKLSDADIATVEQWVRTGAVMPSGSGTN
ncbi:MAG TPA: c-type cytochrome domain-containing protein [Acidobacteriaceae bacterium]|nr:c-type cytochrome domain-containing protein [Acidobacteriaceae bacterium]